MTTLQNMYKRQLFALGRDVAAELRGQMRPNRTAMRATAQALKISQSLAWRAFNAYMFDNLD